MQEKIPHHLVSEPPPAELTCDNDKQKEGKSSSSTDVTELLTAALITPTGSLLQITSTVTLEEPNFEKFWSVESVGTNVNVPFLDLSLSAVFNHSNI